MIRAPFLICLFCLSLLSLPCMGQDWVDVHLDEKFDFRLPEGYEVLDTGYSRSLKISLDSCTLVVTKLEFPPETVEKTIVRTDDHLRNLYGEIIEGTQKSGVEVEHSEIVDMQGLLVLKIKTILQMENLGWTQEMWHISLSDAGYFFVCYIPIDAQTGKKSILQRDAFFSSIRVAKGITRKDQYVYSGIYYRIGAFFGDLAPYAMVAIVVGIVLWLQKRKSNRVSQANHDVAS